MNSKRKFYIEKIALDARTRLVEEGIIDIDEKALNEEKLKSIVKFFGGELEVHSDEKERTCIEKISEDKYIIYYCNVYNYLQAIHELGHAFLNFDDMEIGKKYYFDGSGNEDTEASLFARAFVMPRINFEQVIIDHLNDGKFSAQNVANEYKIDYLEVLARGEELNIGK